MFFDELPPDTSGYMIAGYAIFFFVTVIYLVSLFIRTRNLGRDLDTLEGLGEEKGLRAAAPKPEPAPTKPKAARAKSSKRKPVRKKVAKKR
jgi:hypothetical protein